MKSLVLIFASARSKFKLALSATIEQGIRIDKPEVSEALSNILKNRLFLLWDSFPPTRELLSKTVIGGKD